MAYNLYRYVCFSRDVRRHGNWDQKQRLFNIPILLLILFFVGYLVVGFWGNPDLVMAGILFGGSVFVFVMLLLIRRTFDKIQENEQLEAKLSAAEEASKAKTFFLSNMSHDIRTPLNAIIGYTTLTNQEGVAYEEKSEYIDKIEMASRQLLDIVNDVLDMSRIESGKFTLEPTCVNLENCVREACDLVRIQLEVKKIELSMSCAVSHKWVLCDKVMLDRALMIPDVRVAGIPIIAMTANAFQEDIKKAEETGMDGHIAKPLDIPGMKATLQQVLKKASKRG